MATEVGARQRLAAAEAELVRVTATVDAAIHDAAVLQAQWSNAGLDGEPADFDLGDCTGRPCPPIGRPQPAPR